MFAMKTFARFSEEQQRKDHLRSQFDNVQNLDTYFGKRLLLLAQQGEQFVSKFLHN